jgi:hypothetical protein
VDDFDGVAALEGGAVAFNQGFRVKNGGVNQYQRMKREFTSALWRVREPFIADFIDKGSVGAGSEPFAMVVPL